MRARVGGEGGTDYIHAALDGRLYITRNAVRAVPATDSTPAREAVAGRVTVFDLKTLKPLGEIPNGGGNGAVVDAKSGAWLCEQPSRPHACSTRSRCR